MNCLKRFIAILLSLTIHANAVAGEHFLPSGFSDETYDQWGNTLLEIKKDTDTKITLYSGGTGGYVDMLQVFQVAMDYVKYRGRSIVDMVLIGTNYSAHAIAACSVDKVYFNGQSLMYHIPAVYDSNGKLIKLANTKKDQEDFKPIFRDCFNKGLVTEEEYNKMYEGYELWVTEKDGKLIKTFIRDRRLPDAQQTNN